MVVGIALDNGQEIRMMVGESPGTVVFQLIAEDKETLIATAIEPASDLEKASRILVAKASRA